MGLFKSRQDKEIEKKILINKTIKKMQKFVDQLEVEKRSYLETAKTAMKNGMSSQLNLTVSGLKMTMAQQKHANEMLMNFKITSQMRNVSGMIQDFLTGMSVLSKEMVKTADIKEFEKVQVQFEKAMGISQMQSEKLDEFLDLSEDSFSNHSNLNANSTADEEILKWIKEMIVQDENSIDTSEIDKEIEEINKKLK